jgi:hypothetical protein
MKKRDHLTSLKGTQKKKRSTKIRTPSLRASRIKIRPRLSLLNPSFLK